MRGDTIQIPTAEIKCTWTGVCLYIATELDRSENSPLCVERVACCTYNIKICINKEEFPKATVFITHKKDYAKWDSFEEFNSRVDDYLSKVVKATEQREETNMWFKRVHSKKLYDYR